MTDKPITTTKRDILDRLKVYEEYGPLSSLSLHPETPGYTTGMLLGDTRAARSEIESLRAALRHCLTMFDTDPASVTASEYTRMVSAAYQGAQKALGIINGD